MRSAQGPSVGMVRPISLLALALLGLAMAPQGSARFILVGNGTSKGDAWTNFWDYKEWREQNPLYEGDIVIFTYPQYFHVVWELPDNASFTVCSYDQAVVRGNETAGTGYGFWVTATKEARYFACGIFGHCEYFDQKVVIQATLGPLPENPQSAPNEVPDPRGAQPPPPPARPPPPQASPPPPPPPDTGPLADIFLKPAASQYSTFYSLIQPIASEVEALAKASGPITILAPTDGAFLDYSVAINVALSFQPDAGAKAFFLANLLRFHVIPQGLPSSSLKNLKAPVSTLIPGQQLAYDASSKAFSATGGSAVFGVGSLVDPDLQLKAKQPGSPILVHGVSSVLIPADATSLADASARGRYVYGVDTGAPEPAPGPDAARAQDWITNKLPNTGINLLGGQLVNTLALLSNPAYDLYPEIASQPQGFTLLLPVDDGWALPRVQLALFFLDQLVPSNASRTWWRANLGLYHAIATYGTDEQWSYTNADTGFQTLLKNGVLVFSYLDAVKYWFPYRPNFLFNASVIIPDLQARDDYHGSLQLIDNVLFPYNTSRLLPPSLIPTGPSSTHGPTTPGPTPAPPTFPGPPGPTGILTVSCKRVAKWTEEGGALSLYECALRNTGSAGVSGVQLACAGFTPLSTWNLDSACSVPSPLVAGQTWRFGFVVAAAGPKPQVSVQSWSSGGAVTVVPSDSGVPLSLQCASSAPSWSSGSNLVTPYACTVTNHGSAAARGVKLGCTGFSPVQAWNLNPDCSLPADIPAGQSWRLAFHTAGTPTLSIASS